MKERTRTPEPPKPRPAVRAFSSRELLLASWSDRLKLPPADQVRFSFDQWVLELALRRKGQTLAGAAAVEVAERGELPSLNHPVSQTRQRPAL